MSILETLEEESIYIIREMVSNSSNPVMLYSIGKDSGVLLDLIRKAFYPSKIPFSVMHIDTGYKFPEMYDFRNYFCQLMGVDLIVEKNDLAFDMNCNPYDYGVDKCCYLLKTQGLLYAIKRYKFDMLFGGARRDEEKSRAKERIFSVRDKNGKWNPKFQRPELWNIYNTEINVGETLRVFPLSNWTELDIWLYIKKYNIPIVSLYFAKNRKAIRRNGIIILDENGEDISCRFRSLGCYHCTGAIESHAQTINDIIDELKQSSYSERQNRIIDLGSESSMEDKKKQGYF
jgi:sulfate adenylyltransferase subunit 2